MRSQLLKDKCPEKHHCHSKQPEADIGVPQLPEPLMVDKAVPIALNDIVHRIQLEHPLIAFRYQLQAPKDRRSPEAELNQHGNQLPYILHEYHQRTCYQRKPKYQADTAKQVVKYLQIINAWHIAIQGKHQKQHRHKKHIYQQCRQNLYHRQKAYPEHNLFHQKAVVVDGAGGRLQGITEKEPGKHAAYQPQDKWEIIHRHGLEPHLKNKPENTDGNRRLNKSPQYAKIRAHIPLLQIFLCQIPQQSLVMPQGSNKLIKIP